MSSDEKTRGADEQVPHATLMTWRALRRVPSSFTRPPPRPVGASVSLDPLKIVPNFHISLSDALAGRHLPPLSLKDFEEYLCYEGRSPENLYFTLWFRDYKTHFEDWRPPTTTADPPPIDPNASDLPPTHLIETFTRAKSTFLEPGSNFELTLPSEKRRTILRNHLPPPPSAFEAVNSEVEILLQDAFSNFVVRSHQNISKRYRVTGFLLGVLQIVVSFLPLLLGIYYHQSRWVRLAGWPILASGIGFIYCSGIGVCPVIYSLSNGEMRQIRPYEQCQNELCLDLARTISTVSSVGTQPKLSGLDDDLEAQIGDNSSMEGQAIELPTINVNANANASGSGGSSIRRFASTFIRPYSATSATLRRRRSSSHSAASHHPPSADVLPPPSPMTFDFDGLPTVTLPKAAKAKAIQPSSSSPGTTPTVAAAVTAFRPLDLPADFYVRDVPCFGPLTKVLSDIVRRLQWEIILRSAVMDVVIATLVTIALMFIPEF